MREDKPLRWLAGTLQTPPVGQEARVEAGALLRRLQRGETLGPPQSKPMPGVGVRIHELRVNDGASKRTWRIVYRVDPDAIVVVHWWAKKTQKTAEKDLHLCRTRLRAYDAPASGKRE
ncbi:MAG TPA: type II toxin-antitoxin system RelE/ParE family toxin [Myxococcota bacterium]|nr:type II toxin-antitoxin system RelE/ParE family toxin [Myxococcota bacterium]